MWTGIAPGCHLANIERQRQDHPVAKGINMKEKEELEKLLVSGSR